MRAIYHRIYGDKVIWGITIFLSLLSVPLIYVATSKLAFDFKGGNTAFFAIKHVVILILAFAIIYLVHKMRHTYLSRFSLLLITITIPLLILTMFAGQNINSADRWLKIPVVNLSFQTSDLAKIALISYLARVLSKKQEILDDFKQVFQYIMLPVLLVCGLIIKSDLSTAILILGMCFIMMFFGGVKLAHMGIVAGGGILLIGIMALAKPDMLNRLETWKHRVSAYSEGGEASEGNYQSNLAKASIAEGGVMGTWLSRGKYPEPPQAASDFMFATLLKNFGLVGGLITILLYLLFLFRSIKIAVKAPKMFSALLVVGLSFSIILQAFSNMAVAVGIFPVTGQPLPMISMGGTSIWFTALSIGIILSVSRDVYKPSSDEHEVA